MANENIMNEVKKLQGENLTSAGAASLARVEGHLLAAEKAANEAKVETAKPATPATPNLTNAKTS